MPGISIYYIKIIESEEEGIDHCSIFVLILGTYVPMSLLVVGGRTGWMLFLTNTTLAVIGITLNAIDLKRFDKVSLALYALTA